MLQAHDGLCSKIKKYVVSLAWAPLLMVGNAWAGEPALRLLHSVEIPVSASIPWLESLGLVRIRLISVSSTSRRASTTSPTATILQSTP
jgi:hypothetical protein